MNTIIIAVTAVLSYKICRICLEMMSGSVRYNVRLASTAMRIRHGGVSYTTPFNEPGERKGRQAVHKLAVFILCVALV